MTERARQAILESSAIVGYSTYLELIQPLLRPGQKILAGKMRQEKERARMAVELCLAGERVAVISGGDAGVYGMAGLVLEMLKEMQLAPREVGLTVIPGVTAALKASSLLGAPLNHDFCLISLSDLLTPWDVIKKRLHAAAGADFVIALYNPQSRHRKRLKEVVETLLAARSPETPVGVVREAGRPGEAASLTDLAHLMEVPVDMQTIVLIGNSHTYVYDGYLITPRGYHW